MHHIAINSKEHAMLTSVYDYLPLQLATEKQLYNEAIYSILYRDHHSALKWQEHMSPVYLVWKNIWRNVYNPSPLNTRSPLSGNIYILIFVRLTLLINGVMPPISVPFVCKFLTVLCMSSCFAQLCDFFGFWTFTLSSILSILLPSLIMKWLLAWMVLPPLYSFAIG